MEEFSIEDSHLTSLFSPWEDLSKTSESTAECEARLKKIITHESRLKKIIDDEAKIDYARYKGKEEGIVEVILQGAKKGLDIAILSQITGFSEESVEEILKENQRDQLEN